MPWWSVGPFVAMLLAIALLPLLAARLWERNRHKLLVSVLLGGPVALWMATVDHAAVLRLGHEYLAFIILLGSLFVISGGIVVRGTLAGTPGLNSVLLAAGTLLASLIGTTGASVLLIRPLLRANSVRRRRTHVVVFFIFLVSNIGGLLTPLGDPPLFLGFLRGVPFFWTLRLWSVWLFASVVLLALFHIVDSTIFLREDLERPEDLDKAAVAHQVPVSIAGKRNFICLAGVIAVILVAGHVHLPAGAQEAGMLAMAALSLAMTPRSYHEENGFGWGPIVEVAVVFAGIFATMPPALELLYRHGRDFGLRVPWHFFWATGALSSVLDNAPTYLTFTSVASGLLATDANDLSRLLAAPMGPRLLGAISVGAVFMGANTYIGNGPNFMVKAIAEQAGVRMPGFLGYMAYSLLILTPLYVAITFIFF
jgi:Na+/H+ antiporter NhaD/arsenite permease-like protein